MHGIFFSALGVDLHKVNRRTLLQVNFTQNLVNGVKHYLTKKTKCNGNTAFLLAHAWMLEVSRALPYLLSYMQEHSGPV